MLCLCKASILHGNDEGLDIDTARVVLIRKRMPANTAQEVEKLVFIKCTHRRVGRRKIVADIAALVEEKVTLFRDQVEFEAEFEKVRIL